MTLRELFELLSENPTIILFYFIAIPLTAFLAWIFGRDEGVNSPWKELYSCLVFATCIPGTFAVTLNVYLFLFEKQSVYDTNIYTQMLPILSMVITLWLIRKNVCFEDIPGFGKLGGLMLLITTLFIIMWILEKTHIFVISFMPFQYFLILLLVLLVVVRFGWKLMFSKD